LPTNDLKPDSARSCYQRSSFTAEVDRSKCPGNE
jgi:hypothetical protein